MAKAKSAPEKKKVAKKTEEKPVAKKVEEKPKKPVETPTQKLLRELGEVGEETARLRARVPESALSTEDRQTSAGKFRAGESAVLVKLLDLVDAHPALFAVLAPRDGGSDPAKVETAATRDALVRKDAADAAADKAEQLARALRDYALLAGEEVRQLTSPAYGILRANIPNNGNLRDAAAPITEFYRDLVKVRSDKTTG